MKFSFFMMPCHDPRENPALAFQRDIELIHLADKLGYDEFYIGEHHSGGWETIPAPEMALSMAAANARRIKLGTSVLSAPFHHPFHLAERMCFLDHLTFGRAILGVGPCSLVTDKMLFGMDDETLYGMLHEAIDVIVRLLEAEEPISHEGRFCEGFRMTALTHACLRHWGRRRKASSEGTRGVGAGRCLSGYGGLIAERCCWSRPTTGRCCTL